MNSDFSSDPLDFGAIYDLHFSKVYNYVRVRVGDTASADDIAGRVFERALASWDTFDPGKGAVDAWLIGIARNAVADRYRAGRWLSWRPIDALLDRPGKDPESGAALAQDETRKDLLAAIERLDEREREIIALKFEARMTNRAIAGHTGLTASNVAVIIFRAVKKLQLALEKRL